MNATALEKLQAAFPDATCQAVLDSVAMDVAPSDMEKQLTQ